MVPISPTEALSVAPIGRNAELREIDRYLDRVDRRFAALVLDGDPGIGKTRLWRHGVQAAEARGLRILVARQREADAESAFGGVTDLLDDVPIAAFDVLPRLQRDALDVARLRAAPSITTREPIDFASVDDRVLAAAVMSLLRTLARATPTVVAIDDAQWLDAASTRLLGLCGRRLERDRVGFLLTIRSSAPLAGGGTAWQDSIVADLDPDLVSRLRVGPLSLAAVHELIRTRTGRALPRPVLLRIHDVSGGNPFFALQLATAYVEAGERPLASEALPVPHDLAVLLDQRVDAVGPDTEAMLLDAALLPRPSLALLARLADDRQQRQAEIDDAIGAGIIELDGGTVHFTHPLLRAVVVGRASSAERRAAHARIAVAADDPDIRIEHQAMAADGPDEGRAVELENAASAARGRGEAGRALALLEHALAATPAADADDARRRATSLAEAAFEAGDGRRATGLLEGLTASLPPGQDRAEILLKLGVIAMTEDIERSVSLLRRAEAEAGENVGLRARILVELARFPSWLSLGLGEVERIARMAADLAERAGDRRTLARSLGLLAAIQMRSGQSVPHDLMQRAAAIEVEEGAIRVGEDGGPSIVYAELLVDGDEPARARELLIRLVDGARAAGDLAVSYPLHLLACVEYDLGHWANAEQAARESLEVATTTGREATEVLALAALAIVRGGLGHLDEARQLGIQGLDLATRIGRGGRAPRAALGLVELSVGDAASAWRWLGPAVDRIVPLGLDQPATQVADGAEALAALGRFDEADRLAAWTEANARRLGIQWAIAMSMRAKASIAAGRGDLDRAETMLVEAVMKGSGGRPVEDGRSWLALGSVRRRLGRKRDAADALERAIATFEILPAPVWVDRAQREVARIGGRGRSIKRSDEPLSATEREIAHLVRQGRTNREIALELGLRPKTVEWNLTRIYRKLAVRSRTELAARTPPSGA